jgi:hypothetical protein
MEGTLMVNAGLTVLQGITVTTSETCSPNEEYNILLFVVTALFKFCVHAHTLFCNVQIVQGDQKVIQPILQYLLMVAIQYNLIGLISTKYRDYTRAHAGHVML